MLTTAACHKLIGGGWFYGQNGEKVHFGFNAQCYEEDLFNDGSEWKTFYRGQFQFHDKHNNVSFHGDIDWDLGVLTGQDIKNCEEVSEQLALEFLAGLNEGEFSGTCKTQPGRQTGWFYVSVQDNGQPNLTPGDFIWIETNCTPDGSYYSNSGILEGGNIKSIGHHDS